jgi:hypothetical protein
VKKFARVSCFAARTGKSVSARNNPDKAAATSYRVAGFESGNLTCGSGCRPDPHLEAIQAMFDCENPCRSGDLAGDSFASALENHPRYPALRSSRHRALFKLLDDIVARHLSRIAPDLRALGFDKSGIKIYRAAALTAFRAARPSI